MGGCRKLAAVSCSVVLSYFFEKNETVDSLEKVYVETFVPVAMLREMCSCVRGSIIFQN